MQFNAERNAVNTNLHVHQCKQEI